MKVVAMKCVVGGSFRRLTARQLHSLTLPVVDITRYLLKVVRRGMPSCVLYCATLLLKGRCVLTLRLEGRSVLLFWSKVGVHY